MQRKTVSLLVALLLFSAIPLNVSADENEDIPTNAAATGIHDSLVAALAHADLVGPLTGSGPFTVFAPTDQAFSDAGIDLTDFNTPELNATLSDILLYHVISGASVMSADVTDGQTVGMMNGDDASITVADGTVMINDATVVSPDVVASNGVIHVIDKVLMPPVELVDIPTVADGTGIHTALVAALSQANLVSTLQGDGPFTVFAPTDDAFAAAGIDLTAFDTDEENATLVDILLYHVYSGAVNAADVTDGLTVTMVNGDEASFSVADGTVMVGDATVTLADVLASNGVIHVIDKVLMPPTDVEPDIPTVASGTGVHTSLVAAVVQAGLLETLQSEGPFTVFAPTDDAFSAAGIDLTEFESEEGLATLADILLYHVASGAVTSDMLSDGMTVTMVNQDDVAFTVNSDGVMVNDATVSLADVSASNGVIHVIDKVLMPPADAEGDICYNLNTHTIVAGATQAECDAYMYLVDYEMNGQMITGCYNGVTHQVSQVTQEVCESYMWTAAVDIATTASATTIHNSLVAALAQAELVATLSGADNYTVFAPTDAAFAAAGIDLSDPALTQDALANILLYHVVPGTIMSSDLSVGMTTVTAANGDSLMVHVTDSGVMVGEEMAMVTLADVPASNGVIHVIDKVIMPPADEVACDVTIGISSDGYAFSPAAVTIEVNQTVCWSWEAESMAHNVKEVDGMKSTKFVEGGVTSGAALMTVDFHHTFTEDTIFYYACEPHISVDMFGKITVGDGGVEPSSDDDDEDSENNTPGFLGVTMILATLGAVLFARSNREDE
ncbi:MAG: fasciclin domain-containing protein [Candidatus Poseidoniaceae archaeon]